MPSHLFVLTELYFRLEFLQRIGNLRKLLCHLGILLLGLTGSSNSKRTNNDQLADVYVMSIVDV